MANDGEIHFPPGQRRDKPTFEPPPWERDQFVELAKRKQDAEPVVAESEERNAAEPDQVFAMPSHERSAVGQEDGPPLQQGSATGGPEREKPELDSKQVEILMMGLRSEEPQPQEAYWKISVGVGSVFTLAGLMMTTWGFVALGSSKKANAAAGFIVTMLLVVGIGFVAAGVWVVFRSLRQQGVL